LRHSVLLYPADNDVNNALCAVRFDVQLYGLKALCTDGVCMSKTSLIVKISIINHQIAAHGHMWSQRPYLENSTRYAFIQTHRETKQHYVDGACSDVMCV